MVAWLCILPLIYAFHMGYLAIAVVSPGMPGRVTACVHSGHTHVKHGLHVNPSVPYHMWAFIKLYSALQSASSSLTTVPLIAPSPARPPQSNVIAYSMLGMEAFR